VIRSGTDSSEHVQVQIQVIRLLEPCRPWRALGASLKFGTLFVRVRVRVHVCVRARERVS
jgi:hypothetical protein